MKDWRKKKKLLLCMFRLLVYWLMFDFALIYFCPIVPIPEELFSKQPSEIVFERKTHWGDKHWIENLKKLLINNLGNNNLKISNYQFNCLICIYYTNEISPFDIENILKRIKSYEISTHRLVRIDTINLLQKQNQKVIFGLPENPWKIK